MDRSTASSPTRGSAGRRLEAFVAEGDSATEHLGAFRVFSTAGTTGVPGLFVYSRQELQQWIGVDRRCARAVGITAETRFVAIGAPSALHITRQMFAALQTGRPPTCRD